MPIQHSKALDPRLPARSPFLLQPRIATPRFSNSLPNLHLNGSLHKGKEGRQRPKEEDRDPLREGRPPVPRGPHRALPQEGPLRPARRHRCPRLPRRRPRVPGRRELGKLLAGITIAHGGVLPNINPVLLSKKTNDASSKVPKSQAVSRPLLLPIFFHKSQAHGGVLPNINPVLLSKGFLQTLDPREMNKAGQHLISAHSLVVVPHHSEIALSEILHQTIYRSP